MGGRVCASLDRSGCHPAWNWKQVGYRVGKVGTEYTNSAQYSVPVVPYLSLPYEGK